MALALFRTGDLLPKSYENDKILAFDAGGLFVVQRLQMLHTSTSSSHPCALACAVEFDWLEGVKVNFDSKYAIFSHLILGSSHLFVLHSDSTGVHVFLL